MKTSAAAAADTTVAYGGLADATAVLDATGIVADAADGGAPTVDAEVPDLGPPVACEAGDYFIVASSEAGSEILRLGCTLSGPTNGPNPGHPALRWTLCGEDCPCSMLAGCSDASALYLGLQNFCSPATSIGTYGTSIGGWTSDGAAQSAYGWVRLKTLPGDAGGTVSGDYDVTLLDGGTLTGTFCVTE